MFYGIQFALLVPIIISVLAIIFAVSHVRRHDNDSEDDLGYLEDIILEKGGL